MRGQNNVQGASDSGLIPMMYPDYQRVNNDEANQRLEKFWGMPLDKKPGLTVVEIVNAAYDGEIRGMYIMGENPDVRSRRRVRARGHGEVAAPRRSGYLTETAYLTDVVLPATAWPEKTGTVDQYRPHGAAGRGGGAAGRGARGLLDPGATRSTPGAGLAT